MGQKVFRIIELGHASGIAQIGDFNVAASCKNQFFQIGDFGRGGNEFFQMLKSVPDGYIANGYSLGHPGKNFPIIIFCHGGSP
jgi:hypothetical protein